MYRFSAILVLLGALALLSVSPATPVHAASITWTDLRQAALSTSDLPGFYLVNEDSPGGEGMMQATWGRIFVALDSDGNITARLGVLLLVPSDFVPDARLASLVSSGELHEGVTDSPNFQLMAPLGIGELDQPATWNAFERGTHTWKTDYAETFLRGRMVVHLIYETYSDAADPAAVATLARLQDGKVLSSAALAPVTTAASRAPE